MPRPKKDPRGGPRQGQPGHGYSNRTDLLVNRAQATVNTPIPTPQPSPQQAAQATDAAMVGMHPDQTPNLLDPSQRPNEPVTDGLPVGPGRGPEALTPKFGSMSEVVALKKWLPLLQPHADSPQTGDGFKALVRYVQGAQG